MTQQRTAGNTVKPIGIIDALSAGYRFLTHYWGITLIPIALDIFFWLGPQISPWAAIQRLLAQAPPELTKTFEKTLGLSHVAPTQWPQGPNIMTALAQVPGSPATLGSTLGSLPPPAGWERVVWSPTSPWGLMGILILLLFLGAPIAGLYLALAAYPMFRLQDIPFNIWKRTGWTALQLALLLLIAVLVFAGLVLGLSFLMTLGLLIHPAIGMALFGIAMFFVSWLMLLAMVLFYFTPSSIVLQQTPVWRALSLSAIVVMRHSWSSFGFILIVLVISQGFALIWHGLLVSPWGTLASIVGNAVLTSGLAIATLIFFHDRYMHLMAQLQRLTSPPSSQE